MAIFDKISGISTGSGFKYQAQAPLDARLVVDSYGELAELVAATGAYAGMLVYVKNETTLNTITYPKGYYSYDGVTWTEFKGTDTPGDYNDLTNKPTIPTVPTKVSAFTNDAGYLTSYTEIDPTVPSHVKSITANDITNWNNKSTFDGNYNSLSNKPAIPTTLPANGGNADTVDNKHASDFVQSVKIGTTEYKSGTTVTLPAYPATLKNPNALTIGGKSYDGSSAISVTASDLGIANAVHFIGETTTVLADGTTTAAVTIEGVSKIPVSGDVVLYGTKEFIWNGSAWRELGDGSSHALKTVIITAGDGLTGGGDISANRTLNVGAGNGITVTTDAVAAKAGNGITVDSTGINHADTSSQASITASGRKYITGVTLDTYGHVTGLTTGTETVTVDTLISSGTADPSASIASQYYFKYN